MADKEKVLSKYPDAWCWLCKKGEYIIFAEGVWPRRYLGSGNTKSKAWADAASDLKQTP